ncbi:MAG: tyrosine-type recombinase/integrase [Candidatus Doudnabacteria bacterium]
MPAKKSKNKIEQFVQDFLDYCEIERNKSPRTLRNYKHYLSRFAKYGKENQITEPKHITQDAVRNYRLYLNRFTDPRSHRTLKLATQNYHVIALRAFLKYLAKRDVETLSAEKIELAKSPSREVEILSVEEINRLKEATTQEKTPLARMRDIAILELLFSSGIRISELVQLTQKHINFKSGEFTVRGKGDKLRLVFMSDKTIQALQAYLKARSDNNPALFVSHSRVGNSVEKQIESIGESHSETPGLTARSVQRLIKKYAKLAGIMHKVTPHTFRHSFATDLLQNGADIRSVQTLLGHASITTTQIYTHVTNQQLREVHKKFHNKN